jgi:hypothetical protein
MSNTIRLNPLTLSDISQAMIYLEHRFSLAASGLLLMKVGHCIGILRADRSSHVGVEEVDRLKSGTIDQSSLLAGRT